MRYSIRLYVLVGTVCLLEGACRPCSYAKQLEEKSPSGAKVASVTTVDCSGFGHEITQVNIRSSKSAFSSGAGLVVSVEDKQAIGIWWEGEGKLVVQLPSSAHGHDFADRRIIRQASDVEGVQVVYVTF